MDQVHGPPDQAAGADLRWVCAEYTTLTGRADLLPEHLAALDTAPSLTSTYLQDKLSLLAEAIRRGAVHNPRGFLLRAIENDWRPESAPPRKEDLAARLRALGVSNTVAARVVRTYQAAIIIRQLDWLAFRSVQEPARSIVRAIHEDWGEPRAAREGRTAAGRLAIRQELLDSLETARLAAETPEASAAGARALAEMRAHLGLAAARPPRPTS